MYDGAVDFVLFVHPPGPYSTMRLPEYGNPMPCESFDRQLSTQRMNLKH